MRQSNRMKRILREQSGHPRTAGGQEVHDRINAELHTVGLEHFGEAIAQRMELIEVLAAGFNNDSRMIRRICLEVLDRIASILEPELQSKLDADSRRDMSIAAYLHDIGKSGPVRRITGNPRSNREAVRRGERRGS